MARRAGRRPAPGRRPGRARGGRNGIRPLLAARPWLRRIGIPLLVIVAVVSLREHELFQPVSEPYRRTLYPHWSDVNGDCRTARHETLAAQSIAPVRWSADGCRVEGGRWRDPWSGAETTDPGAIDVDHMVPLAEAHRSGAHTWPPARRQAFANDLAGGQLVAVLASTNRSKADGDPLAWMPPRLSAWCGYVAHWRAVKTRWDLGADMLEAAWTTSLDWACTRVRGLSGP